jgi:hypothetical protein
MNNKRVLSEIDLGKYKKPNPYNNDIIYDPMGQWKYPGENTRIPSNDITMDGVNYPVWAQPNVGPGTMMQPGGEYQFPGADYVDEFPQMKKGGGLKSKKYTKSLEGTNYLFAESDLFKKPKKISKKRIFNSNAKYYQEGGGVSPLEGNLISKVLMNRNRGVDFVDRAYALGANPGTPMFNVPDDEEFGSWMSHKMATGEDDNGQAWMFPTVMNPNDEAIAVPNQYADYISSTGYKNATGMIPEEDYIEAELSEEEIEQYRRGGYIVEDID